QGVKARSAAHVPELHGLVPAARGDPPAVRAESHAPDFIVVGKGQGLRPRAARQGACIPDADGPIYTGRGEALGVWAEGNTMAREAVAAEVEDLLPSLRVPKLDRFIYAGGGQAPAVATKGQAHDQLRVPS